VPICQEPSRRGHHPTGGHRVRRAGRTSVQGQDLSRGWCRQPGPPAGTGPAHRACFRNHRNPVSSPLILQPGQILGAGPTPHPLCFSDPADSVDAPCVLPRRRSDRASGPGSSPGRRGGSVGCGRPDGAAAVAERPASQSRAARASRGLHDPERAAKRATSLHHSALAVPCVQCKAAGVRARMKRCND
jgi:hypothetical protein